MYRYSYVRVIIIKKHDRRLVIVVIKIKSSSISESKQRHALSNELKSVVCEVKFDLYHNRCVIKLIKRETRINIIIKIFLKLY